jgi:folate-binding protein YgfZ
MIQPIPLLAEHVAAGARLVEAAGWRVPADFGDIPAEYEALHAGAGLLDLSWRGRLRLQGADRASFLHNMVTNDVQGLHPGEGCRAAKLDVHGKMEAGLRVLCLDDALVCDVDPGQVDRVRQALDHHRIMEDVRIEEFTADWALLSVQGPFAAAVLARAGVTAEDLGSELRHAVRSVSGVDVRVVRSDRSGGGGFDVWVLAPDATTVWRALRETGAARPAGLAALDVRRIEAGIPWPETEITGEYFPMEAGLDAGWISYTKGCYLGQETISRLHHLGHVNRVLRGVLLGDTDPPPTGSVLWKGDDRVGKVTSAARSPKLRETVGLGYVHRSHADPGMQLEVDISGVRHPARVAALPMV